MSTDIFSSPHVSAWRCGAGVCRIQTTSPEVAAALSRWRQACQVGESVTGGYLRLFDTNKRPHRLKRLLTRLVVRISAPRDVALQATGGSNAASEGQSSGTRFAEAPWSDLSVKRTRKQTLIRCGTTKKATRP